MIGVTVEIAGNENKMETRSEWNGKMQNMVRRSGCDAVLHALKGYEEQLQPLTISMASKMEDQYQHIIGSMDSTTSNKRQEGRGSSVVSLPWMERFTNKTSVNPPTTMTTSMIISQLNNYHRHGSTAGTDDVAMNVTPPSGAVKSPWEELAKQASSVGNAARKHPSPLLLAGSNPAFNDTVGESSISTTATATTTKQLLPLPTKKGVPHVYHDFSDIPDAVGVARKKTGGVTQPFPEKLHTMLDNDDNPSVVSWLPHGRAFLVRKPAEFTSQIMPK